MIDLEYLKYLILFSSLITIILLAVTSYLSMKAYDKTIYYMKEQNGLNEASSIILKSHEERIKILEKLMS